MDKKCSIYLAVALTCTLIATALLGVYNYTPNNYKLNLPLKSVTPLSFQTLKSYVMSHGKYINSTGKILRPVDKNKYNIAMKGLQKSTTLPQLAINWLLLPNHDKGLGPLGPLKNPLNTTVFQMEQGAVGWYWYYATFLDKENGKSVYRNLMFYIMRIELGNPEMRKKYNLPIGSTTVYNVSCGVGNNDSGKPDWHYTPLTICQGKLDTSSNVTFNFDCVFEKDSPFVECNFSSSKLGLFNIVAKWTEGNDKIAYGFNINLSSQIQPFFNLPNGCAPCTGGGGTNYWSYTQLNVNGNILFNNKNINVTNGIGWLDRQWGGTTTSLNWKMIENMIAVVKNPVGLGRYIWVNLHFSDKQYMVYTFLDWGKPVSKGDVFDAFYNAYYKAESEPVWRKKVKIKVEDVVKVGTGVATTVFPSQYSITLEGVSYFLDSTPFGETVTIDVSGNTHWTGSAITYSGDRKEVLGTSFFEGNSFLEPVKYRQIQFENGGFSKEDAEKYADIYVNKKLKWYKGIFSYLLFFLPFIIYIAAIVLFILFFVRRKKCRKENFVERKKL